MNLKAIEKFLIEECGHESLEDAIKNTPQVNLYPIYGEIKKRRLTSQDFQFCESGGQLNGKA